MANYAMNPTPEQALRSNRAVLPARVIAALDLAMTFRELEEMLRSAHFFSRCGQFQLEPGAIPIQLAIGWNWLPTSRDQLDPIHGVDHLQKLNSAALSTKRQATELSLVKAVLIGQRSVTICPVLIEGPEDYTQAALGGAQFAVRMAARELLLEQPSVWFRAVMLYVAGYWPCGFLANHDLVVY